MRSPRPSPSTLTVLPIWWVSCAVWTAPSTTCTRSLPSSPGGRGFRTGGRSLHGWFQSLAPSILEGERRDRESCSKALDTVISSAPRDPYAKPKTVKNRPKDPKQCARTGRARIPMF